MIPLLLVMLLWPAIALAQPTRVLLVSASPAGCQRVAISWAPAQPQGAPLFGYKVIRNKKFLAWTINPRTEYNDRNIDPNTDYTYTIAAVDTLGRQGAKGVEATITVPSCIDTIPPEPPQNLAAADIGCTTVTLIWDPAVDEEPSSRGIFAHRIFRNGDLLMITGGSVGAIDRQVVPNQRYVYSITAMDRDGNVSEMSDRIFVNTPFCRCTPIGVP